MKTRLATIIFALLAPVLSAQEATPAAAPAATPTPEVADTAAKPPKNAPPAADGTGTSGSAALPDAASSAATSATSSSMSLSGTRTGAPGQDGGTLFSEPNLESTMPEQNTLNVPPGSEADRMPADGPTFRKTKTSEAAEELKEHIRVRQVKTRAIQDPKVQEALDRADAAQTLPERREAMRDYYNALYDRMVRIDSSVKKSVEALRKESLQRLDDSSFGLARKSRGIRR